MFRRVVKDLCRKPRGLALVAGAIGVLAGMEQLLSSHASNLGSRGKSRLFPHRRRREAPAPRIKISQTRSELGFVYWVVRETGSEPSYALFDTWQEAINEATRRIGSAALVTA